VQQFSFVADGFTGGGGGRDLSITVFYDATHSETFIVNNVTSGQVIKVQDLAGFGDPTWGDNIYAVDVKNAEPSSSDGFRLNNVTVSQYSEQAPADLDYNFTVNIVDGDGDVDAQSFSVHLDGDSSGGLVVESIAGTSGNNTLNGTSSNDILTGGSGDDTLSGGLGADTFIWNAGNTGHDSVSDFSAAQGDTLNVADLLSGGMVMSAVAESGHLQLQFSDGGTVVQTIDLTNMAVANNTEATNLMNQLLTSNNIVD
jgi:Ca2+-binding RTX toxin-like protein